MATNDFLTFATGMGARVMSQANYLAAAWRTLGFDVGIAVKEQLNKVWRQSAFVSSSLAKFMVDRTGNDVLDDGNQTTFNATLALAIASVVQQGAYVVAGGAANALTATPAPAFPGYTAGQVIYVKATAANTSAATINVSGIGVKNIIHPDGSGLAASDIVSGAVLGLIYDGTSFQLFSITGAAAESTGGGAFLWQAQGIQ